MINQGFAYNAPKDSATTRIVAITAVDPAARTATGMTRERSLLEIDCSFPVGGMIVTPAAGEQWYVQKLGLKYILSSRLPANAAELNTEAIEGQVQVGTVTGPLTLHGSEVQVESNLKLGKTLYRDNNGVLESSTDNGTTWSTIQGGTGAVSSVAGKTGAVILTPDDVGLSNLDARLEAKADLVNGKVPDTQIKHRVFQFANYAAFPSTGAADTFYLDSATKSVYAWVGGAFTLITGSASSLVTGDGTFDLGDFLNGFLPGAGTLLEQIFNALNDLTGGGLENLGAVLAGLGDLASRIVQAITGIVGGTIENLGKFFEGFLGFDPITGAGTLIKQFVSALSGGLFTGGLAELTTHFGGLISGAGTFLQQIIKNITGIPALSATLTNLGTFFTNIRSFLGSINFLDGSFNLGTAAQTFINSILAPTGILSKLSDLQSWLTGVTGGSLQTFFTNLRTFLGGFNLLATNFNVSSAATTFINSILAPTGILTTLANLQSWLTGTVGGSLPTFFTNLRTFLGNINFLDSGFNLTTAASTFINSVLSLPGTLVKLVNGLVPVLQIPDLSPSKITDLILGLTGSASGNIKTFFDNIRSFLGSINFLDPSFNVATAAQTFLTSILAPANAVVSKFASLTNGLIPDGLIPNLDPSKITDLVLSLTGSASGNIKTFFDNLRSFLGSINFLSTSFNPTAAAQSFLSAVLAPANAVANAFASLANGLIPDGQIPQLSASKITDLVLGLTGSASGNIKTFFDNLRSFLGSINFLSGSFSVTDAAQTFLTSILGPANAVSNTFAKLVSGLIPDGLIPNLSPSKITDLVLGLTGSANGNIKTFFDNVRLFLGSINFLDPSFNASAAVQSFLTQVLAPANTVVNAFAKLVNGLIPDGLIPDLSPSKITGLVQDLTGSLTGNIKTFFDNLRLFLGNVNLLDPSFNPNTAAQSFMTSVLKPANAAALTFAAVVDGFISADIIPTLNISKITNLAETLVSKVSIADLVQSVTGAVNGTMTTLTNFFSGFDLFTGANNLVQQLTNALMGTGDTLANLRTFFGGFDPFTGANSIVKQLGNALTNSGISLASLSGIATFFTNIRSLLGNLNFLDTSFVTNLGSNLDTWINSTLKPRGIFTAVSDLATAIGGTALNDITWFLKNLAALFGQLNLRTIDPASFNPLTAASTFLNWIFSQAGSTLASLIPNLTSAKIPGLDTLINAKADITTLVQNITGLANGTLANLGTFFGGLPDPFVATNSATTFVQQLVKQITGTAGPLSALANFFTNVRSFLGSAASFLGAPGSFNLSTVAQAFLTNVLAPANDVLKKFLPMSSDGTISIDTINNLVGWTQENISKPIISTITGFADQYDLGNLGDWARNVLGRLDPLPAENLVGSIATNLLGIIPISHISQTNPNLLSEGSFNSFSSIEEGEGWSWDESMTDYSGSPGAAKTTISSATLRELFSAQNVPVNAGDRLDLSGWIRTSGLTATSTHTVTVTGAYGGSFRLTYGGVTSTAIAYNASAATVQTALAAISTIGSGNVTVTGSAGSYSVTIGGTAGKLTGTSSLAGGTLSVVSSCPISLSLLPFVGENQLTSGGNPVTVTIDSTGSSNNAWSQLVGNTYTVPSGVTSVLVRLAVNANASAGSVWWSTISLTKTGLLQQSLVDRLTDAWNNFWNGIFGTTNAVGKTVDDILTAAGVISSAAGTADLNGKTAIVRIQDALNKLLSAPAELIGSIGGVLVDGASNMSGFLTQLWNGLSGLTSGISRSVYEVFLKAQALFGNVTTATNTADGAATVAGGANTAATGTRDNLVGGWRNTTGTFSTTDVKATTAQMAAANTALANSIAAIKSASGTSYAGTALSIAFSAYPDNSPLSSANMNPITTVGSGGAISIKGGVATWSGSPSNHTIRTRHNIPTTSNFQKVGVIFGSVGSGPGYIYARMNAAGTQYVYAKFQGSTLTVGYNTGGGEQVFVGGTKTFTGFISSSYWPGSIYWLECGTANGAERTYRVLSGDTVLLSVPDPGYAVTGSNNLYVGFGGSAVNSSSYPPDVGGFAFYDNFPISYTGSAFKASRTIVSPTYTVGGTYTTGASYPGYYAYPNSYFAQEYKTSDYTWDATTNKLTIGVEGWYQVSLNQLGNVGIGGIQGGQHNPCVFKNGATRIDPNSAYYPNLVSSVPAAVGPVSTNNNFSGFQGWGGTMLVYCKKNDYLQPGYYSSFTVGSGLVGEANGLKTIFSVQFMGNTKPTDPNAV